MIRFFVSPEEFSGTQCILAGENARHAKVLRLKAGEEVLLQGVVDCCIEEDGELVIIDYKTDRVSGATLEQRAEFYAAQLQAYARAMERITGKRVRECVLYFLAAGKALSVPFDAPEKA